MMLYENVCIEGLGYVIPDEVVTTAWIEEQLAPVYQALGLPFGYIERSTGIREHRWWPEGFWASDGSAQAGRHVMERTGIAPDEIQCLINASVSRDYVEPATAAIVHHKLGLSPSALSFDVVNACLGFLNGMVIIANMIELGQIDTGLVVAAEDPREGQLSTIKELLANPPNKEAIRDNLASFTLGSAAVAMILRHKSRSKTGKRLLGGAVHSNTDHCDLCVAQRTWMRTNSTKLLVEGARVVETAFRKFKAALGWTDASIDKLFTHQVSEPQRIQGVYGTLGLPQGIDYPTLSYLGNTASVAAPICMALGIDNGFVQEGDRICLMGAGSGLNSVILGIQW